MVTDLHQEPIFQPLLLLSTTKDFQKVHIVTWQAVAKEELGRYHTFEVVGKVEGIGQKAIAKVSVEGIIAASQCYDTDCRSSTLRTDLPIKWSGFVKVKVTCIY